MIEKEECIVRYQKIIDLLDSDFEEIALAVQGEILDKYRQIIMHERDIIENARENMRNH